ncbi:transposase [Streptomyces sp. NPDC002758]
MWGCGRWLGRSRGMSMTSCGRWSSRCFRRCNVGSVDPGACGIRTGCFLGILFVPHTGIAWGHLPHGLSFGSGMSCRRRPVEWTEAGVWPRMHEVLLVRLHRADAMDLSRAAVDGSGIRASQAWTSRRHRPGGMPYRRANAQVNAASEV